MTENNTVPKSNGKSQTPAPATTTTPVNALHLLPELRHANNTPSTPQPGDHDNAPNQPKGNNRGRVQGGGNPTFKSRGERVAAGNTKGHPSSERSWWRSDGAGPNTTVNNERVQTNRNNRYPQGGTNTCVTAERGTQTPRTHPHTTYRNYSSQDRRPHVRTNGEASSPPRSDVQSNTLVDAATPYDNAQDIARKQPTNPRVMLANVVARLGGNQLISKDTENALEEYIHTQRITQQDKDICSMEEQQQVDALNTIAKKYPYDGSYGQSIHSSPVNLPISKSWLQQKVEEELGPGVAYLITGPDFWNRLGFDTTCVYAFDLIYTTSIEKEVEGLRLRFKKVNFELPESPVSEWFVVDMCNNIQDMDITVQEFTFRLRRLVVDGKFDGQLLRLYAAKFGTPQTCEIIEDALICYVHQSPEFSDLIRETAARYHARDVVILRDYLITHVLYSLQKYGHKVYLKGGCSLSLGYNLITRTSEDVDLRIDPSDGVIWEVNGKDPMAAEASRMEYFLTLIDSMLIEDGDVKLDNTKCKTTQAVYHVTFNFPRIHHTPIAIVLEVMHKVAPFYEQCAISSKLHDHMKSNSPKYDRFKPNYNFLVDCAHPMQTLYEKIHAVYQNYNKFKRNDVTNINAPKWIRHLGDAYIIIKYSKTPLPVDWDIERLQKELAKSGDFVVDLTLDHPSLKLDAMDSIYFTQVEDAYYKHLQDAYYGEARPPALREVCETVLDWLSDKPINFMSYRVSYRPRPYKKHFNHQNNFTYTNNSSNGASNSGNNSGNDTTHNNTSSSNNSNNNIVPRYHKPFYNNSNNHGHNGATYSYTNNNRFKNSSKHPFRIDNASIPVEVDG